MIDQTSEVRCQLHKAKMSYPIDITVESVGDTIIILVATIVTQVVHSKTKNIHRVDGGSSS